MYNLWILYIKATVVVSVRPSVCLAGQGQGRGRAGVVVSVCLAGQGAGGRAGQGGQTISVTLRIADFWPRSGFGNFEKSAIKIWEFQSPPPPPPRCCCCVDS